MHQGITLTSEYINNPLTHKVSHKLTLQEQLEEEIFLGFRKTEGINIEKINKKLKLVWASANGRKIYPNAILII